MMDFKKIQEQVINTMIKKKNYDKSLIMKIFH